MITEKEGYNAMFYLLDKWYKMTKSDEIGEILSFMECLEDGEPADPIVWYDWEEAITKAKIEGKTRTKKLH